MTDTISHEEQPQTPPVSHSPATATSTDVKVMRVDRAAELPGWASWHKLAEMLHYQMAPYNDELADVYRGLDYALSDEPGKGGFVILARVDGKLAGAVVMLHTGMSGFVPENLLLFVVVNPALRGRGVGGQIIERALSECRGDVKLHVEPDNPARRLYERLGFDSKYVEMRYRKGDA